VKAVGRVSDLGNKANSVPLLCDKERSTSFLLPQRGHDISTSLEMSLLHVKGCGEPSRNVY
jgi:hypothetical protein